MFKLLLAFLPTMAVGHVCIAQPEPIPGTDINSCGPAKNYPGEPQCSGVKPSPDQPVTATWVRGTFAEIGWQHPNRHEGGFNEISCLDDDGKWRAIARMYTGYPLFEGLTRIFIPFDMPLGRRLCSWNWIAARTGPIEFYSNCFWVNVVEGEGEGKGKGPGLSWEKACEQFTDGSITIASEDCKMLPFFPPPDQNDGGAIDYTECPDGGRLSGEQWMQMWSKGTKKKRAMLLSPGEKPIYWNAAGYTKCGKENTAPGTESGTTPNEPEPTDDDTEDPTYPEQGPAPENGSTPNNSGNGPAEPEGGTYPAPEPAPGNVEPTNAPENGTEQPAPGEGAAPEEPAQQPTEPAPETSPEAVEPPMEEPAGATYSEPEPAPGSETSTPAPGQENNGGSNECLSVQGLLGYLKSQGFTLVKAN